MLYPAPYLYAVEDYRQLQNDLIQLLRNHDLIMVGDSTTRYVFAFLKCVLDGVYQYDHDDDNPLATSKGHTSLSYTKAWLKMAEETCHTKYQQPLYDHCSQTSDECQEFQFKWARTATTTIMKRRKHNSNRTKHTSLPNLSALGISSLLYLQNYMLQHEWERPSTQQRLQDIILESSTQPQDKNNTRIDTAASVRSTTVIYLGMPCMHSLWTPGPREHHVRFGIDEWLSRFTSLYQHLPIRNNNNNNTNNNTNMKILVGTSNSICNEKLGTTQRMVDLYLKDIPIPPPLSPYQKEPTQVQDEEETQQQRKNQQQKQRQELLQFYHKPNDYSGLLLPSTNLRKNHSNNDYALFHDWGATECTKIGMQALLQQLQDDPIIQQGEKKEDNMDNNSNHNNISSNNNNLYVLDMMAATTNGCDYSKDGRHYSGPILFQQASLIVQVALQQQQQSQQQQ